MENSIISEGKTTKEAIENGLKILKVSANEVNVKVLENEEKRSFFSILAPRVVKVELTLKESKEKKEKVKKEIELTQEELNKAKENVENFLKEFFKKENSSEIYNIEFSNLGLKINFDNEEQSYLIGYRGETLYALQNILTLIASKSINNRVRVILDIAGYREKRQKTLEELADKIANTVIKNRKAITLEPMQAYERKIIHSRLQTNERVETRSIGEEPRRRVVISLKNNRIK